MDPAVVDIDYAPGLDGFQATGARPTWPVATMLTGSWADNFGARCERRGRI